MIIARTDILLDKNKTTTDLFTPDVYYSNMRQIV